METETPKQRDVEGPRHMGLGLREYRPVVMRSLQVEMGCLRIYPEKSRGTQSSRGL